MMVSSPPPPETDVESEELVMIASSSSWVLTIAAHTSQSHPSLSVSRRLQAKKKVHQYFGKKDRYNPKKIRQSLSLSLSLSLFLCLPCPCECVRVCVSLSLTDKQNHTHDDKILMSHCSCHALFVIAESSMNRRHVPQLEKCAISSFAAGVGAEGGNCALVVL